MPKEINDLEDMTIMEISLVDDPACPGADVILMKRRTDLVDEAAELLSKREVDDLLDEAEALLKRDVGDEPRDERGRWTNAAVQLLQQGRGKVTASALQGVRFLHGQAKEAATAVATKTGRSVRSGVHAIRTTKLTGAHAVEGGGVQFNFEHGFTSGARLETRVQVRPEHVEGSAVKTKALKAVHEYLASTRGDAMKPFTEEGQSSFFRYEHRPGPQYLNNPQSSLFRGQNNQTGGQNLPAVVNGKTDSGLPTYQWQGRAAPGQAKWSAAFTHQNVGFIPEGRSDMQEHIIHVNNWVNSNRPKSLEIKAAMTRPSPNESGEKAFFTPKGDYVPEADRSMQWRIMRQYEERRGGREAAGTILSSQLPFESTLSQPHSGPAPLHLNESDTSAVEAHFDAREDREESNVQWTDPQKRIASRARKELHLDLSPEEVQHLERSLVNHPDPQGSRSESELQQRISAHLMQKRRVRRLFA